MRSTVVVTLRSLTSKVPRSPNLRPSQRGSCPPFITPCFEPVIGSCNWDSRILGWAAIQLKLAMQGEGGARFHL